MRVTVLTTFLEFCLAETDKMTKLKTSSTFSLFLAWVDFNHSMGSVSQQDTTAFDKAITNTAILAKKDLVFGRL